MSIRGLALTEGDKVIDPSTGTNGVFVGRADYGRVLIRWDGFDAPEQEDPEDVEVCRG